MRKSGPTSALFSHAKAALVAALALFIVGGPTTASAGESPATTVREVTTTSTYRLPVTTSTWFFPSTTLGNVSLCVPPQTGAVIGNGTVELGVDCAGHLNIPYSPDPLGIGFMGLRYIPTAAASTEPGCQCEAWGAADNSTGVTGQASRDSGGVVNLSLVSFTSSPTTAVSTVDVGGTLRVTHDYHPSPATPNLFEVLVSITNTSANPVELLYRRVMDWDIFPTAFDEFVTIDHGTAANLFRTNTNGFMVGDPLTFDGAGYVPGPVTDAGPLDHGAMFDFNFGTLPPDETMTFKTFYGAAATETAAAAAVVAVGAEAFSFGQPNVPGGPDLGQPNTFIFAFAGIGGEPILCGNGQWDPGESCDPPGSPTEPFGNPCRSTCTFCGDGFLSDAEECEPWGGRASPSTTVNPCTDTCMWRVTPSTSSTVPPTTSTSTTTSTTLAVCGNEAVEGAEECDDGNTANGDCCSSQCTLDPPNTPCPDGDVCNGDETCDSGGTCNAGSPLSCDDNQYCNGPESCDPKAGCLQGAGVDCSDGVGCTNDSCNETTDQCDNVPDDGNCTDELYCTGVETCDANADCQTGTPIDCDDAVSCTDDSCNEETDQCDNVGDDANCDDGDYCNGDETCDDVLDCQAGTAITCDDGVGCTDDSCNETTDQCESVVNNASCDDGAYCNGTETCDMNADCLPGTSVDCNDEVNCTDDSCNEDTDQCDNVPNDAGCDDGEYCNGAEVCDVNADCQSVAAVDCTSLDGECTSGSCDEDADECVGDPINEGGDCAVPDPCTLSSECQSGVCTATSETFLSASCRWIAVAGASGETVRLRTDRGSLVDANTCGDTGKIRGETPVNIAITSATGTEVQFRDGSILGGDIATGGTGIKTAGLAPVPGTELKTVAGGVRIEKEPPGTYVDTTGTHALIGLCETDQDQLVTAATLFDGLAQTGSLGNYKIKRATSAEIDITGQGLAVIDLEKLTMGGRSTLTLRGLSTDVLILRSEGNMKISYGSHVILGDGAPGDALQPQNVLFYGKGRKCRFGRSVEGIEENPVAPREGEEPIGGGGTFFCPAARKFKIGNGAVWTGSFLGSVRELRLGPNADLQHKEFSGR